MNRQFLFIFFLSVANISLGLSQVAPESFKSDYHRWVSLHPEGEITLLKALNSNKSKSLDVIFDRLQNLTALVIRRKNIQNLDILKYAPKLNHLTVIGNSMKDISFVEHLPELRTLHLGSILQGNQIENIDAIRHAKKLTDLNLNHNQIQDLSPLAGLPLESLSVRGNFIKDFSPLADCKELRWLYAQSNLATRWPKGEFPALEILELNHNKIKSFEAGTSFPALYELSIRHNDIHSMERWPKAPLLQRVFLRNNPLTPEAISFINSPEVSWAHDWQSHPHGEVEERRQSPQQNLLASAA